MMYVVSGERFLETPQRNQPLTDADLDPVLVQPLIDRAGAGTQAVIFDVVGQKISRLHPS